MATTMKEGSLRRISRIETFCYESLNDLSETPKNTSLQIYEVISGKVIETDSNVEFLGFVAKWSLEILVNCWTN